MSQQPDESPVDDLGADAADGSQSQSLVPPKKTDAELNKPSYVRVREIDADDVERLQSEEADVEKVPRKDVAFEPAPAERRSIEDGEWTEKTVYKLKWILSITVGVVGLVIVCMMTLHPLDPASDQEALNAEERAKRDYLASLDAQLRDLAVRQSEASSLYGEYAKANVIEEIVPLIRDAGELEPLIRESGHEAFASRDWRPHESANWTIHIFNGKPYARMIGELPDYSIFRAYFVLEENELLLDWKATTAFSSASYEDLMKGKGDASEVRGAMLPDNLYTPDWPEDRYDCYQLVSPTGLEIIWCYLPKRTPLAEKMSSFFMKGEIMDYGQEPVLMTLKLRKREGAGMPNQWEIEALLHQEWINM